MLNESKVSRSNGLDEIGLSPAKIRWFYKDDVTKKWTPFSGYDSIMIETHFSKGNNVYLNRNEDSRKRLLVRENLFEVNISERLCYPIYWKEEATPILRGSWFRDPGGPQCTPIEDEFMAAKLEIHHHKLYNRYVVNNRQAKKSPCEENTTITKSEGISNKPDKSKHYTDFLTIPAIFSSTSTSKMGTRIGRGYFEDADLEDQPLRIAHLCFVVHGMGQKYLKGSILKSCDELRATSKKLIDLYFPDVKASQKCIEFLPVEWRSSLRLDGNIVNSLTLKNLGRLRYFINCTFMDIMYYTSPLYRFEISRSLLLEINRLYNIFIELNSYFESNGGRVTILAHSLGCVIAYDLITGWIDPFSVMPSEFPFDSCCENYYDSSSNGSFEMIPTRVSVSDDASKRDSNVSAIRSKLEAAKDLVKCLQSQLNSTSSDDNDEKDSSMAPLLEEKSPKRVNVQSSRALVFASRLENLVCVGSPLPIYLTLRGIHPGSSTSPNKVMPKNLCPHIYNIFHPSDPVAYRLEPLILKHYASIPPVEIYKCSDPAKTNYHIMHNNSILRKRSSLERMSTSSICDSSSISIHSSIEEKIDEISKQSSLIFSGVRRSLSFTDLVIGSFWRTNNEKLDTSESHKSPSVPKRSRTSCCSNGDDSFPNSESSTNSMLQEDLESSSPASTPVCAHSSSYCTKDDEYTDLHLEYRMDYQLRESRYESSYFSALTVHTSYFSNPDLVMFLLMQIFPQSTSADIPVTAS